MAIICTLCFAPLCPFRVVRSHDTMCEVCGCEFSYRDFYSPFHKQFSPFEVVYASDEDTDHSQVLCSRCWLPRFTVCSCGYSEDFNLEGFANAWNQYMHDVSLLDKFPAQAGDSSGSKKPAESSNCEKITSN